MRVAVIFTLLLAGCFPVRPDTPQAKACTAEAVKVADSKYRADSTLEMIAKWNSDEGRAYDACMAK